MTMASSQFETYHYDLNGSEDIRCHGQRAGSGGAIAGGSARASRDDRAAAAAAPPRINGRRARRSKPIIEINIVGMRVLGVLCAQDAS